MFAAGELDHGLETIPPLSEVFLNHVYVCESFHAQFHVPFAFHVP